MSRRYTEQNLLIQPLSEFNRRSGHSDPRAQQGKDIMDSSSTVAEPPEATRRRRRSSDPYFALWSLCSSVIERRGVLSATVIDDYYNIIASAGDSGLAGLAVWNARTVSTDEELERRVRQQARSIQRRDDDSVSVTRRYALVSPARDAFQFLLVTETGVAGEKIAESSVAAVHRILNEKPATDE